MASGRTTRQEKDKKWKLKKIRNFWFLDVDGELKRLNILDNAKDVQLEDNVIFADESLYQLMLKSGGETMVREIEDVSKGTKAVEHEIKNKNRVEEGRYSVRSDEEISSELKSVVLDRADNSSSLARVNLEKTQTKDSDCASDSVEDSLPDSELDCNLEKGHEEAAECLCCDLKGPCPKVGPLVQFRELEIGKESVTILGKLISGCFGKVVHAGKLRNSVDVAVKTQGKMTADEFLVEAKLMHHLQHKNIVELKAVCLKSEPIWIITELMINGILLDYLRRDKGKTLELNDLIGMAMQVADGMAYIGKQNVVLMDLRAANILSGENNEVKIGEFHLAKLMEKDVVILKKNSKYPFKWTAPEAAYDKKLSIMSDVWSYGVLLFELITFGAEPYPGIAGTKVLERANKGFRMQKPTDGPVPCPDPYYEIMLKCWDRTAENRPTFENLSTSFQQLHDACKLEMLCSNTRTLVLFEELEVPKDSVELRKKLGNGRFGDVYAGKLHNRADVAVKTLTDSQMTADDFLAQAKLMHHLRHSNILQLLAISTKLKPFWIITELMIKGDLLTYLRKDEGKTLLFTDLVYMAGQIADGMAYLGTEHVILRDLRAANIYVGDLSVVKIGGFGLARIIEDDAYEADENTKLLMRWTAPEAAFDKKFSIKSDVWSYGVLLYELITFGKVPYPGMKGHEPFNYIERGFRMQKPTGGPISCPDPYYDIMLKCWNKVAECRPTFEYLQDYFSNYMFNVEINYTEPSF